MEFASKRYILTGGPGSGKSSLIALIQKKGVPCYSEVSRELIAEQQQIGGNLFPWEDMVGFSEECYRRMRERFEPLNGFAVFDRGIPDVIAYLKWKGFPVLPHYVHAAKFYNNKVFICPPWEDIFENDMQRPESFEESYAIYELLHMTYKELGFDIVIIPKLSIEKRADFILEKIMK